MIKAVFIFAILATATLQQTSVETNKYESSEEFHKLVKGYMRVAEISESLGVTPAEAAKMMAMCVYDLRVIIPQLSELIKGFKWDLVMGIVNNVRKIWGSGNCQAFKYLQLTPECGQSITAVGGIIKLSWETFWKAANWAWLKNTAEQLLNQLRVIGDTCVKSSAGEYLLQTTETA